MKNREWSWPSAIRSTIVFGIGAAGAVHEVFFHEVQRPYVLAACISLAGLPLLPLNSLASFIVAAASQDPLPKPKGRRRDDDPEDPEVDEPPRHAR